MVARRVSIGVMLIAAAALAGACSKKAETAKKPLTTVQRDSLIGESKLPGAAVVKKSLEQSDSAKARAARENNAGQN